MFAFDIETTGLDLHLCQVTVVCTEDFHTGERRAYEFGRVSQECVEGLGELKDQMVETFNVAQSVCAFNDVRFNIQFLYRALQQSEATKCTPIVIYCCSPKSLSCL